MPRINMNIELIPGASQDMLKQIHTAFGATPNMFKAVANFPAALKSMWGSFDALGGGTIGTKLGEQIIAKTRPRLSMPAWLVTQIEDIMQNPTLYPKLDVVEWINTPHPIQLADVRGRVVVLHAFQMLCPGCVQYGIPQAERIVRTFSSKDVVVLGLHTVFEHHDVMTPAALRAFASEYRMSMPIGIDRPAEEGSVPRTMRALQLRGTPSLVLIDKAGRVRHQHLGQVEDLRVGAEIGVLMMEKTEIGPA